MEHLNSTWVPSCSLTWVSSLEIHSFNFLIFNLSFKLRLTLGVSYSSPSFWTRNSYQRKIQNSYRVYVLPWSKYCISINLLYFLIRFNCLVTLSSICYIIIWLTQHFIVKQTLYTSLENWPDLRCIFIVDR